jgi:hypothetical protein
LISPVSTSLIKTFQEYCIRIFTSEEYKIQPLENFSYSFALKVYEEEAILEPQYLVKG